MDSISLRVAKYLKIKGKKQVAMALIHNYSGGLVFFLLTLKMVTYTSNLKTISLTKNVLYILSRSPPAFFT